MSFVVQRTVAIFFVAVQAASATLFMRTSINLTQSEATDSLSDSEWRVNFGQKYHSTDKIFTELESLPKGCSVKMKTAYVKDKDETGPDAHLFVVKVGNPSADKKVMVAANEHARELLTGEVALRFIQKACKADATQKKLFEKVQFIVVPVVNEKGRERVETGDNECQRMTVQSEGDVDLNRNMDVDWGKGSFQSWGHHPFSQYQSRILRDLAADLKPLAFIDLHTGARTLMTSWGYRPKVDPDFADQEKALKLIQEKHCPDCQIGSNRVVIGYENPGEVIDHMYAKQMIKYTSLWELYEGSSFGCLGQFNPPDSELEEQVENWANALLTFGSFMQTGVRADERSNPGPLPASLLEQVSIQSDGMMRSAYST